MGLKHAMHLLGNNYGREQCPELVDSTVQSVLGLAEVLSLSMSTLGNLRWAGFCIAFLTGNEHAVPVAARVLRAF